MATEEPTASKAREQLPTPLRAHSEDGTIRLMLTARGVSLRLLSHEFNFVVRAASLEKAGVLCGSKVWTRRLGNGAARM